MSKLTRTIAGRKVHAVTRTVTLAEISRDARYQHRLDDNPYIRGKDIAKSVRDCGAERFRDNIIAVEIDGTLYVVDGFGRQAAAAMLKWDHLDVDIIQGRNPAAIAQSIALRANLGQVSQKGNTAKELAAIAYRQHVEEGLSYDAIAAIHGTRASVVAQRVMRGNAIVADLEGTADPATVRVFPCQGAAKTAAIDVFKAALKVGGSTYDDVCQALEERYNVTLCLLVGNNEKQVYRLLYDALERADVARPQTISFSFTLPHQGTTPGPGTGRSPQWQTWPSTTRQASVPSGARICPTTRPPATTGRWPSMRSRAGRKQRKRRHECLRSHRLEDHSARTNTVRKRLLLLPT